jgi:hypothetical protein
MQKNVYNYETIELMKTVSRPIKNSFVQLEFVSYTISEQQKKCL